jgi:hypothetical protein
MPQTITRRGANIPYVRGFGESRRLECSRWRSEDSFGALMPPIPHHRVSDRAHRNPVEELLLALQPGSLNDAQVGISQPSR